MSQSSLIIFGLNTNIYFCHHFNLLNILCCGVYDFDNLNIKLVYQIPST